MEARHGFAILAGGSLLAVLVLNCSSPETVPLGQPNALVGRSPPPATGINPNGDASSGNDLSTICNGGPAVDGGTCSVSFKDTLLGKYMGAGGTWKCADASCHGPAVPGAAGQNQPTIDPSDPMTTWNTLRNHTETFNTAPTPYINPCTTDPTKSSITCNIDPNAATKCGNSPMPQTGGAVASAAPTTAELADLKTWLTCGSPFN